MSFSTQLWLCRVPRVMLPISGGLKEYATHPVSNFIVVNSRLDNRTFGTVENALTSRDLVVRRLVEPEL